MDPNVALLELRDAVKVLGELDIVGELEYETQVAVQSVLDRFHDLDDWLTRQRGFLPRDWDRTSHVEAIQRELDARPSWNPPTRDQLEAAQRACSFTTLGGGESFDQQCVDRQLGREPR